MDPCVYYLFCYSVITYTHASIAILHYYNNQSHWLSYSMTLVVLLFVDPLKLNILTSRYKNSAKQVILSCQLIFPMHSTKCWIQFSFHKRFTVLMKHYCIMTNTYVKTVIWNCSSVDSFWIFPLTIFESFPTYYVTVYIISHDNVNYNVVFQSRDDLENK